MWPNFNSAMRLVLPEPGLETDQRRDSSSLLTLPGLCCQAAGKGLEETNEISAAWLLLYTAAHTFDTVEDGDLDPQIRRLGGAGPAINVATGLLLSAAIILNSLRKEDASQGPAGNMAADYLDTILVMTSGQHCDLTLPQINLKQWWQIAEAKSGAFFSLACRSGAQLAKCDKAKVNSYSDFGFHLGLMLQILDDLEDFQIYLASRESLVPGILRKSLAVAYADSVLAETEKNNLSQLILDTSPQPEVGDEIIDILDGCGAGLYMLAELEKHFDLGMASLVEAQPAPPAGEKLEAIIRALKLD
ncbi:MAG: polyprenyl synthetase family protein [Anaerolineales bacterium]|nr:polyprenyl synthetase family protein [Anaerolineales bacterium]